MICSDAPNQTVRSMTSSIRIKKHNLSLNGVALLTSTVETSVRKRHFVPVCNDNSSCSLFSSPPRFPHTRGHFSWSKETLITYRLCANGLYPWGDHWSRAAMLINECIYVRLSSNPRLSRLNGGLEMLHHWTDWRKEGLGSVRIRNAPAGCSTYMGWYPLDVSCLLTTATSFWTI